MNHSPNVVWIVLDSVRTDHTSMGGYERDTTPNLDQIAGSDDGDWYPQCIAHSNATRTSTASMVSGTYPSRHQVRGNRVIPDALDTIPGLLSDVGYRTACISRNANSSMGFDRGFDEFTWISSSTITDVVPYRTLAKYALNVRRHSAGLTTDTAKHATPFLINDMAKRTLRDLDDDPQPYFLYLHYNEPHRPYYSPLPYLEEYTDEITFSAEEAAEFSMRVHRNLDEILANGLDFTEDEWEALLAMYDAELAYTDEMIGRLFGYVQSLEEDTIFVVTADHGELFGEEGLLSHKILLHDALVNVPLVVHGFDEISHQTDELVQHIDVLQTVLAIAGGETEQLQGIDLRTEVRDFAVSQVGPNAPALDKLTGINPEFDTSPYHSGLLTALRTKQYKYLTSDGEDARTELFELLDEENDRSEELPEVADRLDEAVEDWLATYGQPVGPAAEGEFTDAMEEQLEDLGYMM